MHGVDVSRVDLNLLAVLGALLEHGSVTGAAKALGITQPSVSHALGRLRAALADPILARAGRGMVRTPRAEALRPEVARLLAEARRVLSPDTGFDPATSDRAFSLACPDLLVAVLPDLLGRLSREAPRVRLSAAPPPADLAARLGEGAIDLAVLPARDEGPGLVQRVIGTVDWCVVARRGHPALRRGKLDVEGWLRHPHVIVHTAEGTGVVSGQLSRLGHARRVALVAPSFLAAPHALLHTDWLFAAPRALVEPLARSLGLSIVPPPVPLPKVRVGLVWHERLQADPGHRWLRDLLAEAIEGALGGPRRAGRPRRPSPARA